MVKIDAQPFAGGIESLIGLAGKEGSHKSLCIFSGALGTWSKRVTQGQSVDRKGTALDPVPGSTADDLGSLSFVQLFVVFSRQALGEMRGDGDAGEFSAGCVEEAGCYRRERWGYAGTGAKVGEGDCIGCGVVVGRVGRPAVFLGCEGGLVLVGEREERVVWRCFGGWIAMGKEDEWHDLDDHVFAGRHGLLEEMSSVCRHPRHPECPRVHRRVQWPAVVPPTPVKQMLAKEPVHVAVHTRPLQLRIVLPVVLHHHHPCAKHHVIHTHIPAALHASQHFAVLHKLVCIARMVRFKGPSSDGASVEFELEYPGFQLVRRRG